MPGPGYCLADIGRRDRCIEDVVPVLMNAPVPSVLVIVAVRAPAGDRAATDCEADARVDRGDRTRDRRRQRRYTILPLSAATMFVSVTVVVPFVIIRRVNLRNSQDPRTGQRRRRVDRKANARGHGSDVVRPPPRPDCAGAVTALPRSPATTAVSRMKVLVWVSAMSFRAGITLPVNITWSVMPLTLATLPFEAAVTIASCLGPGRKLALTAGTWITIVSGVLPEPRRPAHDAAVGSGQCGHCASGYVGEGHRSSGIVWRADEVGEDGNPACRTAVGSQHVWAIHLQQVGPGGIRRIRGGASGRIFAGSA